MAAKMFQAPAHPTSCDERRRPGGFTMLEVLVVVAVIGIVSAFALPKLFEALEWARYARSVREIRNFSTEVEAFRAAHDGGVPIDWSIFHSGPVPVDPWGNEYVFNSFHDDSILPPLGPLDPLVPEIILPPGISNGLDLSLARRRNGSLAPINSKYDLFSAGPDGDWQPLLIFDVSFDDIIFANDGGYVGKASEY
jgi:general secretion pathway protein G